ncbi:MAG: hypothetical protein WB817_01705 [Terriglobales bacterium]
MRFELVTDKVLFMPEFPAPLPFKEVMADVLKVKPPESPEKTKNKGRRRTQ